MIAQDDVAGRPPRETPSLEQDAAGFAGARGRTTAKGAGRKDGSFFWANVLITALHASGGRLLGFAKVRRDLTERRAAQERAIADARRLAAAEAASRTKSEFTFALRFE